MKTRIQKFAQSAIAGAFGLLVCLLGIVGIANLAGLEPGWVGHLAHFPVHCGLGGLLLAFGARKVTPKLAAISLVLGTAFLIQPASLWLSPSLSNTDTEIEQPVRLLSFNVLRTNRQHALVLRALQDADADILYLTELNPIWREALRPLFDSYPHQIGKGPNLLLSRFPLEQARAVEVTFEVAKAANETIGHSALPISETLRPYWWSHELLMATAVAGDHRLSLVGLHAPTPRSDLSILIQKATALVIAANLPPASNRDGSVVLGDLNTSNFSPTFRFFVKHTDLLDSTQGFGHSPSWGPLIFKKSRLPWLGTAIDHILVSKNISVSERETGPDLGSDHRWVMARLSW